MSRLHKNIPQCLVLLCFLKLCNHSGVSFLRGTSLLCGLGELSQYSISLWAGQSRDWICWGQEFPHLSREPWAHPASYSMGTRSFLGAKWLGCGIDHPTPSSAEVKERVELYLFYSTGPSWPILGWTVFGLGLGTQNFTPAEPMFSGTISDGLKRDSVGLKQEWKQATSAVN